ncbi:hypothetical protein RI367_006757 [Sorochytrium milnesiophthora]
MTHFLLFRKGLPVELALRILDYNTAAGCCRLRSQSRLQLCLADGAQVLDVEEAWRVCFRIGWSVGVRTLLDYFLTEELCDVVAADDPTVSDDMLDMCLSELDIELDAPEQLMARCSGNERCLDLLHREWLDNEDDEDALDMQNGKLGDAVAEAVSAGNMRWLKRMHGHFTTVSDWSARILPAALGSGHIAIAQWIVNIEGSQALPDALDGAAGEGQLEALKWAHALQPEAFTDDVLLSCARQACHSGHMNVLLWLDSLSHTTTLSSTADHPLVAQLVRQHDTSPYKCDIDRAVKLGLLDMVTLLHRNGGTATTRALLESAIADRDDIGAFLARNRDEGCDLVYVSALAGHGCVDTLEALRQRPHLVRWPESTRPSPQAITSLAMLMQREQGVPLTTMAWIQSNPEAVPQADEAEMDAFRRYVLLQAASMGWLHVVQAFFLPDLTADLLTCAFKHYHFDIAQWIGAVFEDNTVVQEQILQFVADKGEQFVSRVAPKRQMSWWRPPPMPAHQRVERLSLLLMSRSFRTLRKELQVLETQVIAQMAVECTRNAHDDWQMYEIRWLYDHYPDA